MSHVTPLGNSEAKEILTGAVYDCLKNRDAVLAQKDEVAKKIDTLYGKCRDADAEAIKRVLDADEKGKEDEDEKGKGSGKDKKDDGKKDEEEGKGAQSKDYDAVIAAAVDKAMGKFNESVDTKIDAAMKKILGRGSGAPATDSRQVSAADNSTAGEDASYLVRGVFGNR
jgi:hypothetical protein